MSKATRELPLGDSKGEKKALSNFQKHKGPTSTSCGMKPNPQSRVKIQLWPISSVSGGYPEEAIAHMHIVAQNT